jgi:isoleucyl-tRNA synthetase
MNTQKFNIATNETNILKFWQSIDLYSDKIVNKNKDGPLFNFQDGPPFVSSANLHFGHVHIGIMKSFLVNYLNMNGYNVLNKSGKDCHGLPIETIVSGLLELKTNDDIKEYGLAKYNEHCEKVINTFSQSWNPIYDRIGRFIDYNNEYYTMDLNYMESVWWAWKQLYDKNLTYHGYKIMPYSTACGTPISASEASGDDVFREVIDPAIYVKFELKGYENTFAIVWTTTPWTLPSNLALAMNSKLEYVKVFDLKTNEYYILAKNCLKNLYGLPKKEKLYDVIETFLGDTLKDIQYIPIFDYFATDRIFKIIMAEFVEDGNGSGIVHLAPSFGQDDFDACVNANIITVENVGEYCPINDNGFFTDPVVDYKGEHVLSTNNKIIERLKQEKKLLKKEMYKHSYPHCPRTDTPLIYKVVSSFFVKVTEIKDMLLSNNDKINWVPETIGTGRFKKWLENAKDWGVSRSRFFGTPIPIWMSDDGQEVVCIGSIDELMEKANLTVRPTNLHPQYVNDILIPSSQGKGMLKRTLFVLDCWFESGCVPFANLHYPFENKNFFDDKEFLSDFICEGLDQTRGWFYTLSVLSTAIFNKPAFKNVICSGLILAEDGKKFSKRLGNFVDPIQFCNNYGADALRFYLTSSAAAHGDAFKFNQEHIENITLKFFQLYNALSFLIENVTKYVKDRNKFNINAYQNSNNVMDNFILARLKTVVVNINLAMASYKFHTIKQDILDFVEDLVNWYIKFNRNRLKGKFCDVDEQGQALSTLYRVMIMLSKISAPFIPFLAETMYQKLDEVTKNDNISVHLSSYPSINEFPNDLVVERRMKRLQMVSKMVRALRMKTDATSVKVPLKHVTIVNEDIDVLNDLKELEKYLYEDTNALKINYETSYGEFKYTMDPNSKELGKKFKNSAKNIKQELEKISKDTIIKYLNYKDKYLEIVLDGNTHTLDDTYFKIIKEYDYKLNSNEVGMTDNDTLVIVNHSYDDEVIELHTKRLLIVGIQNIRKNTNLKPWDKIGIYYKTNSEGIKFIFSKFYDDIHRELGYPVNLNESNYEQEIVNSTFEVNGQNVNILITTLS